jgi:predicted ATPase/class 3 adenylate cyclase
MQCPRCQQENPPQAKFCPECATPLAPRCTNCGTQLPAGAKFCFECATPVSAAGSPPRFASPETYTPKHLAERIINSKAALEGERKQVTVLFADLKGSMELLADRDPEEARKILDPVLERMMEAVHRYEGTVNQVMGDGIMALFGAPVAHEDHALRACLAALRMQELVKRNADDARRTHGVNVKIRVGLNSGEVVVRAIGSDLHMDYTAVGQSTHLAARMEQLADPGASVITPDTLALVEGYVEVKALGPVSIKGLHESLDVYELTGTGPARTRLQAAARRGLTRFVGRNGESEQLQRAQQLVLNGRGQVAAIVGEAGVGKSRLLYEFSRSRRLRDWLVLASGCVSHRETTSYLPVIDLLRSYFQIQDRDETGAIRARVTDRILMLDESPQSTLPALLAMFDAPVEDAAWQGLDAMERRQRTVDAVKWLLQRLTRAQPLLVIIEDLHWIDGETQSLLDALVDSIGSTRLMLLVTYRPEYQHGWGDKTYFSQLRLDALSDEDAGELLESLLGKDVGLDPLKQLLIEHGNPFFLEETVRTLVETKALTGERGRYRLMRPVQAIQVPPTVQAILAARIDRLLDEDKRLLQVAAVVGKNVPLVLLQTVANLPEYSLRAGLSRLQDAEFIYETELFPDLGYTFKHALTQEVAYGGLLQDRRRLLHARLVEAIETLHGDRIGDHVETLAHHALRADLREKAAHYLHQAGLKATARSTLLEARSWFDQALALLRELPETRSALELAFDVHLDLRPVLGLLGKGHQGVENLREAEALADRLNDGRRQGRALALVTNVYTMLGELDAALAAGNSALEIAARLGDGRLRTLATTNLEQTHYWRGEYNRVVELATANLRVLSPNEIYDYRGLSAPASVFDRSWLVLSLAHLGEFRDAAEYQAETIRLAELTQHAYTLGRAYYAAGMLHLIRGEWEQALIQIDRWIAVARSGKVLVHMVPAVASASWVLMQLGRTREALRLLEEGEQLIEDMVSGGSLLHRDWAYHALGRAWLLLGRAGEAERLGDQAFTASNGHPGISAYALHLLGDVAACDEPCDEGRGSAYYRRALTLAEPRGMRPLVAHCHLGLGKLYHRTDQREQAQEHLGTATTMYREMGMTYWLEKAEAEIRELG